MPQCHSTFPFQNASVGSVRAVFWLSYTYETFVEEVPTQARAVFLSLSGEANSRRSSSICHGRSPYVREKCSVPRTAKQQSFSACRHMFRFAYFATLIFICVAASKKRYLKSGNQQGHTSAWMHHRSVDAQHIQLLNFFWSPHIRPNTNGLGVS